MADQLFLSAWLHDYNTENMLQHWQRIIEAFPLSPSGPGIRSLTIFPFNWSETPVVERSFGPGATAEDLIDLAADFSHDDYAYEAEATWDLWQQEFEENARLEEMGDVMEDLDGPQASGWKLTPVSVSIACTGPGFDPDDPEGRPHIQINFGVDAPFLPAQLDDDEKDMDLDMDEADVHARQNLKQLIEFVHRLDDAVPVEKRLLWCESGESLADKVMAAWNEQI